MIIIFYMRIQKLYTGSYHWAIGALDRGQYRWECDDFAYNSGDTLHQIWFKRKSSGNR